MKLEKGSGPQGCKPTCGNKHYGKFVVCIGNFFDCGKDGDKMRDCPTIASIGK